MQVRKTVFDFNWLSVLGAFVLVRFSPFDFLCLLYSLLGTQCDTSTHTNTRSMRAALMQLGVGWIPCESFPVLLLLLLRQTELTFPLSARGSEEVRFFFSPSLPLRLRTNGAPIKANVERGNVTISTIVLQCCK